MKKNWKTEKLSAAKSFQTQVYKNERKILQRHVQWKLETTQKLQFWRMKSSLQAMWKFQFQCFFFQMLIEEWI